MVFKVWYFDKSLIQVLCIINITLKPYTHISNAEQGDQESQKGCGKCEKLPVSLEDLEVIAQACDDCLHATHLCDTHRQRHNTQKSTH